MIVIDADRVEEIVDHLALLNSKLENTVLLLKQLGEQMDSEQIILADLPMQEAAVELNGTISKLATRLEITQALQNALCTTPGELRDLEKSQIDELQKLETYMQTVYCGFTETALGQDGNNQIPVENVINTSELQQTVFDSVQTLEMANIAALSNIAAQDAEDAVP